MKKREKKRITLPNYVLDLLNEDNIAFINYDRKESISIMGDCAEYFLYDEEHNSQNRRAVLFADKFNQSNINMLKDAIELIKKDDYMDKYLVTIGGIEDILKLSPSDFFNIIDDLKKLVDERRITLLLFPMTDYVPIEVFEYLDVKNFIVKGIPTHRYGKYLNSKYGFNLKSPVKNNYFISEDHSIAFV